MKWPNLKFFQAIGVLGFGVGVGNAYAGYNSRATARELVYQVNRMSIDQGSEVAEEFASRLTNKLNQKNVTRIFQGITLTSFGIGVTNFIRSKNGQYYTDKINELNRELVIARGERDMLADKLSEENIEANMKLLTKIDEKITIMNNNLNSFINRYQGNQFDSETKFSDGITNLSNEAQSVTKAAKEAWDQVNKNNILDLEWLTKSLNEFYSQLGLGETLAAVNLSGCLVVIVSMISIIIVLYSDTLIEKYKIVERYPRLTNIIEIRRKFQKYYLIWDISVILGVVIIMASLNIWFIFT